jgi:hypothetical protein
MDFEIEVQTRVFTKTLELLFIQCELDYENIEYRDNEIVIVTEKGELRYPKKADKRVILSDALDLCWNN